MKKALASAAIASALLLTGCAGGGDRATAREGCIEDARSQLPSNVEEVNTSKLETTNMSDAFKELADNPLPDDPDADVLWTTVGDIWYREDGNDRHASVLCFVTFEDGQPSEPIEATLTYE